MMLGDQSTLPEMLRELANLVEQGDANATLQVEHDSDVRAEQSWTTLHLPPKMHVLKLGQTWNLTAKVLPFPKARPMRTERQQVWGLDEIHTLAKSAARELDGRHGDPSRAARWIRERKLALIVLALLTRISSMGDRVEVNDV